MNATKVLVIIGVVLLGLGIWGANLNKQDDTQSNQYFRQSYMDGCVKDPAYKSYCDCTYDRLTSLYGIDGLIDAAPRIHKGNFTSAERAIIKDCSATL
jgi:hypothetical protein